MFRNAFTTAAGIPRDPVVEGDWYNQNVFDLHPLQLANRIEQVWEGVQDTAPTPFESNPLTVGMPIVVDYPHLIYAYLVENTRIHDIFLRVVTEFATGERLETPDSPEAARWLRNTEELFFRDPPPFFSFTLTSAVRPDAGATRRGAYYRMFGLELNHGTTDNRPYPFVKPTAANREFIPTFELLGAEVWRGITNASNSSGTKDTDDDAITTLCTRLADMLTVRRMAPQVSNLSREEFWAVATMSWFHLTISYNSPIVDALKATATSPEERLRKIGERVGVPCHAKSQAFLRLADYLSVFLRQLERNTFSAPGTAAVLYNAPMSQTMAEIITQYSVATGRDIKARAVKVATR